MKKTLFFMSALLGLALLTSCEDHGTWDTDTSKRWYAGEDGSNLYGYIDENGKMVIAANYTYAASFSCGWGFVEADGEYMFVDRDGKTVTPDAEPTSRYFYYNRLQFWESDGYGMYDENFKQVIPANYYDLGVGTADGLIYFSENGKEYGYLDMDGKVVIDEQFGGAYSFAGGIAVVMEKKDEEYRYAVIDKKGNFLVDFQKKILANMGEGLVRFYNSTTKKYGMMDKKGNEIVSAKYDDMQPFTCGVARVRKNDKYGYINTKGEEVIPCRYASAFACYSDVIDVYDENDRGSVINKKGEVLFKMKEADYLMDYFINGMGLILNSTTGQYRYVNTKGETIYKWTPASSPKAPEMRANAQQRRREFLLGTEYGPLFLDMERAEKEMKK